MPVDALWNNLVLAVIAIATAANGYFQWRNNQIAHETRQIAQDTRADVAIVEKATNSMKDALVKATADASLLKGRAQVTAEVAAAKAKDATS